MLDNRHSARLKSLSPYHPRCPQWPKAATQRCGFDKPGLLPGSTRAVLNWARYRHVNMG